MVLKRSSSLQLVVATTTTHPATTATSIWERLPYNVGMELHSFPNAAAAAAASNNCCQQQRQHSFENSPPQRDMLATTTTPLSRGSRQQERPAAATEEIDILQQQPEHNKFPVDYSTKATTATDVVTQLKVQKEAGESRSEVVDTHRRAAATERNPNTNSTTTTTAAGSAPALQPLSRCCCGENTTTAATSTNTKVITTATGDIPQGTTPVCRSSSSSNGSGNAPPGRALQQLRTSDQHKYKGQLEQEAQDQEPLRPKDAVVPAMWSPCASLGRGVWLLLLLTSVTQCCAGRQDALSNCTFPARWEGSWFLSGYQQSIHIKGSQFSYRGKCAASDGNKYLIVDEKGCHRCLVIYEKHKNVLQYKESECEGDSMYLHQTNPSAMAMRSVLKQNGDHSRGGAHPNSNGHSRLSSSDQYIMRSNDDMNDYFCKGRETLQNLCDQIPGDALLYSLFRESAEPVKCPLKGPFVFTYNRGHGECKSPVSNIDSCTEDSRLLLSFQACPDVQGTESTVEELTCLATWKDGNSRYLVGLVSHHHAISNEERYRCFVYEKISSLMGGPGITSAKDAEYKLAQSGDATCNGLDSAEVGSRIMSLRKPPPAERCDFPAWFKGPRHWHALMGNAIYNYHSNDGSMHIIKPNGYMETRALCEQINKQTATEMMAVVHYTTGCQSGFMCMMFYRRDTHVIEIQTGKQASRLEDACAPDHFDVNRMPFITLLANNPDPQICPLEGLYNLRGAIGPPYISSRHKRNHNNKAHSGHGHHHLQHDLSAGGADGGAGGNAFGHKRHNTLSFRNSDEVEHSSWHSHTRGVPNRSRRAATATAAVTATAAPVAPSTPAAASSALEVNGLAGRTSRALRLDASRPQTADARVALAAGAALPQSQSPRSRRDAPGCVVNYKAQRQLMVGCTEENIIDVRERCNDDGDEEYSCHGSWSENGTVYIIARHKGTKHGVCVSYRPTEAGAAKLVIGDACYRGPMMPPEHHLVANLTVFGKCGDTSAARPSVPAPSWGAALAAGLASATAALALALAHPPLAAR